MFFFEAQAVGVHEVPDRAIAGLRSPGRQLRLQGAKRQVRLPRQTLTDEGTVRLLQNRRIVAPIFAGAQLPVARWRCDHFTTEDTATPSAAATVRVLSPRASRAIARLRRSIDNGPAMPAGLHPGQHDESEFDPLVNPRPIQIRMIPL